MTVAARPRAQVPMSKRLGQLEAQLLLVRLPSFGRAWVQQGESVGTLRADPAVGGEVIDALRQLVCTPAAMPSSPALEAIHE